MKNGASIILLIVVVLALGGDSSSFTPPLNKKAKCRTTAGTRTALAGWFDSKPSDGHSKANDDMFEAQQEMLRARRGDLDKDERKSKNTKKKTKEVSKSRLSIKSMSQPCNAIEQDAKFALQKKVGVPRGFQHSQHSYPSPVSSDDPPKAIMDISPSLVATSTPIVHTKG
jgi:hypothetical protein